MYRRAARTAWWADRPGRNPNEDPEKNGSKTGVSTCAIACWILARVVCADETPVRVGPGPKARKKYLLVACTNLLTDYFLGDRSLASFEAFVFPDLAGAVVVHDRYQC